MKQLYTPTLVFFLFLLFFTNTAYCQKYVDSDKVSEVKSLLNRNNDLAGFGTVDFKVSELVNQRAMILGARGGLVVNRRFLFGLGGYGIATKLEFDGNPISGQLRPLRLYGGYAGMLIGGMIAPEKVVHLTFPVLLGAGGVEVSDESFFATTSDSDYSIDRSAFFVVEPGLELEVNVTRVLRLAIGGSYRWISGSDLSMVSDDDLTNWSANFGIRFGGF